jgi:hypothetical protein
MLTRHYILAIIAVVAAALCLAAQPAGHDGSTKAKAIPLEERGTKAVVEEMAWMLKCITTVLSSGRTMLSLMPVAKSKQTKNQ